ncbi:hypothetical protein HBI95_158730 [Parastagonospora nodorum]|nr:hypothetical protein HBH42_242890 [Parastagonospora nodorum]KAH4202846.1 hypothetical protein HBI95_158730 [Parastagonospora nodorum]KAH5186241.1 hypothetical protein HBH68_167680 [Parastagonospora nodorum]KAH5351112.1 hypothetical protein HBI48_163440 [Parastagonospora nodorum]KAH6212612.1 hypothetical protein HBI15_143030 [Parastagonospora nodorum]
MAVPTTIPITFNDPQLDVSSLRGRSVLVTGGAAGIGLACARKIAEAGALVTISDLNEASGQAAAKDLSSAGLGVQFVHCDVRSYAAQVEMYKRAITFGGGRIDLVIPNAGIMSEENLFDMASATVYNTCYLAMHYFRLPRDASDTYKPSIVLISSLAGYVGYPSSSTYSISKFGVRGLFYGIRDRASRETPAVRINLVAPWYIETAMTQNTAFRTSEAGQLLDIIGFAPMDRVVAAVLQFAANEQLHGRAAGVFPTENEDLGDDLEGIYGGMVLQKHMQNVMVKVVRAMTAAAELGKGELERTDSATAAPAGIWG